MFLLQIQLSGVYLGVLYALNLFHDLFFLLEFVCQFLFMMFLFKYQMCMISVVYVCVVHHHMWYYSLFMIYHFMNQPQHHTNAYASHSCIIVTETPESETVEPEPSVEFFVEPEKKLRQAAKHDSLCLFKLMQFSYLTWVLLDLYIILFIAFLYLLLCITLPSVYFTLVLVTCQLIEYLT